MTKAEEKLHAEALALVDLDRDLTAEEREFVLDNFQEISTAANSTHGAFFTPGELANDLAIEILTGAHRILDLGAGIGRLSHACQGRVTTGPHEGQQRHFTCIESNPDYLRVGRRVMPDAEWILGDILDVPSMGLDRFDMAIANPPFGAVARSKNAPGYNGARFEYHVIAVASMMADDGVFIVPQRSSGFEFSGKSEYRNIDSPEYRQFRTATGLTLEPACSIDTSLYRTAWHGVTPVTEVVFVDFTERAKHAETRRPTPRGLPRPARHQYMLDVGA
ncbi:N-6 DNA methylase (plasmid) [Nocardia sp. NBC_01377]|uniref:N-6 DNA methylase n=1 Tax=Nocardia sp. NBC_01377 TaxID=2903595 RepID=UPI00324D4B9D